MLKPLLFLLFALINLPAFALGINDFILDEPKPMQNIQFTDGEKSIHNLNDFRGKAVLLNFWSTWCIPCVKEMPALAKLQETVKDRDIVIIPLSIDYKGIPAVEQFYKENAIGNLPVYVDEKGQAFRSVGIQALPTTMIIDKRGNVTATILGEIDWNAEENVNYLVKLSKE